MRGALKMIENNDNVRMIIRELILAEEKECTIELYDIYVKEFVANSLYTADNLTRLCEHTKYLAGLERTDEIKISLRLACYKLESEYLIDEDLFTILERNSLL